MEFEWDTGNRERNWIVHGVAYEEAEQCFFNPSLQFDDVRHSQEESRRVLLGTTDAGRPLTVVYTVREDRIRVVSARSMSRKERGIYGKSRQEEGTTLQKRG